MITKLDLRINFFVVFIGFLLAFLLKTELALAITLSLSILWLIICKQYKLAFVMSVFYLFLNLLGNIVFDNAYISGISVVIILLKRMLIPSILALPLTKSPIGVLLCTMGLFKIPKSITLSLAVMFSFIPTLGNEYRAIRISQKFRGIGITPWSTMAHPIKNYETMFVPLLIRITKIADELAASAMLRGADSHTKVTCYYDIKFKKNDYFAILISVILFFTCITLDNI